MATRTPLTNLTVAATRNVVDVGLRRALVNTNARTTRLRAAANADPDYGEPAEPRWTEIDWSQHTGDVELLGRRVRYVEIGEPDGRPIVLVHGITSNWQNWLEQLPRLAAEGYRAFALDLPGHGLSEMPAEEISMAGYGRTVNAFCDAMGLGPVSLCGHSMGGLISAETAIQFPDRVERLVLVGAAGISHVDMKERPIGVIGRIYPLLAARKLLQADWVASRPAARHAVLGVIFRHPSLIRPELTSELIRGAGCEGFPGALRAIAAHDFRERLPEVGCPTLIVWGSDDMLAPIEDADEFERLIEGSRKIVMEDTGHMINSERPDAFNRELLEFLAADEASESPAYQRALG